MQVRTRAGEVFSVWLTRRLMQRLWPALLQINGRMTLGSARLGVARCYGSARHAGQAG
jgi:hypothetical protein